MRENQPGYFLTVKGNLIVAKFWGEWDIPLDLRFMDELAKAMQSMRGRGGWALIVDMREWSIPSDVSEHMQPAKANIERRNQCGECWLIKDERQGAFLLPFFDTLPFELHRTKSKEGLGEWLNGNQCDAGIVLEQLASWSQKS